MPPSPPSPPSPPGTLPRTDRRRLLQAAAATLAAAGAAPVLRAAVPVPSPSAGAPGVATWTEHGRPTPAAAQALALLAAAGDDGLRPERYQAAALAAQAQALGDPAAAAAFSQAMDDALQRFLRELRHGRTDPRRLGFRVDRGPLSVPSPAEVRQAAAEARLPALADAMRPRIGQYGQLRAALARHRALATRPWPVLPGGPTVRPGEALPGAQALRERLVMLGDLDPASAPPSDRLDEPLAAGLRRFQARHGLADDGVLGAATRRALDVTPARRAAQIELALERLRWLPDLGERRVIGINIPMFRLWAGDLSGVQPLLTMNVVVGKALNTQTPLLHARLRHLIFRPYWNVPRSIVRGEVLPALARDPGYLARHGMELVRGASDASPVVPATAANLALLRDGQLRLRQRPGPKNALGLVKFIFPNDHDVYLHGTPAQSLFARPRRDFSHGCVRVEDPTALAQWLLHEQPAWSRERIVAAMNGERPQQVNLREAVPVLLFYVTAMVMPGSGALHFAEDVYGHDARLAQALAG